MLTPKQHQLLMFIHGRLQKTGISPSFDEMKEALALKSKSGIHRLITALEERGFIQRLPHKARALQILRLPETVSGSAPAPAVLRPKRSGFKPSIIEGSKVPAKPRGSEREFDAGNEHGALVPVMGRIAAGSPIEAIQTESHQVGVPRTMLKRHGRHYALEVNGDSMVEAGILDGDTVLIQECSSAENGEIVVALVDDQEATLKRLRSRGQTIALEAANPDYETRIYRSDQVKVQGRLVGLLRRY